MNQIFNAIMMIKCKILGQEVKFTGEPLNHAKLTSFME